MVDLPRHLDRETVEQFAEESTTVFDFAQKARVSRERAQKILHEHGLKGEVKTFSREALES